MIRFLSFLLLALPISAQIQTVNNESMPTARVKINNNFSFLNTNKAGLNTCTTGQFGIQTTTSGLVCIAIDWSVIANKPLLTGNGSRIVSASSVPADGCAVFTTGNLGSTGTGCGGAAGAGNTGDAQMKGSGGGLDAMIMNQSGNKITVSTATLAAESIADPDVNPGTLWNVDGDFAQVSGTGGGTGHFTYTHSTGSGDFWQNSTDQAIPVYTLSAYTLAYYISAVNNPGGTLTCQIPSYITPSPVFLTLTVGAHTVDYTTGSPVFYTDIQCNSDTAGQSVTFAADPGTSKVLSLKRHIPIGDFEVKGNTTATGNLNSVISVSTCGVVGDGITDDTAALQACIDGVPNYTTLLIPQTFKIRVTSTINWHGKTGMNLMGVGTPYIGPGFSQVIGAIIWAGAHNGTVIDVEDTNGGTFQDFGVMSYTQYDVGDVGAAVLINVDQTMGATNTMTSMIFRHLSLQGVARNPLFQAIAFSMTSQTNVEHMLVENTFITCSGTTLGTGITIGSSYNAIGELFQWNTITGCHRGIWEQNGGGHILNNQFNLNTIHIELYPDTAVKVTGNDTEHCAWQQTAHEGAWLIGSGQLEIANNRIAACDPGGGAAIIRLTGGSFTISNNYFDQSSTATSVSGNGVGTVISTGNLYAGFQTANTANNVAGFKTLALFTSIGDQYGDGGNMITSFMGQFDAVRLSGAGKMYYNWASNKYRVLEDGPTTNTIPQYITPFLQDIAGSGLPTCDANPATGAGLPGSLLFDPVASNSPMYYCGKVGGSPGWTRVATVSPTLTRSLPANINDTIDLGTWNWTGEWGINFEVFVRGVDNSANVLVYKQYKFSMAYSEGTCFKAVPMSNETVVTAGTFDYDLEACDAGTGLVSMRLRNTAGFIGTTFTNVITYGSTGFTASSTVNTGVSVPGVKKDAVAGSEGGKFASYGDILLKPGAHLTNAAAASDTAGTITITNPATTASVSFTTPFGSNPVCTLTPTSDQISTIVNSWVTVSTSAVTANVHTTPGSSITFAYHCMGNPN